MLWSLDDIILLRLAQAIWKEFISVRLHAYFETSRVCNSGCNREKKVETPMFAVVESSGLKSEGRGPTLYR